MMDYKKAAFLKTVVSIVILALAYNFERALGIRAIYFTGLGLVYIILSILRNFAFKRERYIFSSFFVEIILIFLLEIISRYIINYPIHILYFITIVESAVFLRNKRFLYIGIEMSILSSTKFVNQIILSRSYSKIGESVFFILITFLVVLIIYLLKYIQKEKEKTELIYEELKLAYDNLKEEGPTFEVEKEDRYKILNLTDREREICSLIAQGKNNKEIAKKLYLSEGTVKNHITNIFNKLELRDRTQLAVYSLKNNIS
jgi:DNA-binding CsgD family transcriptional regulator